MAWHLGLPVGILHWRYPLRVLRARGLRVNTLMAKGPEQHSTSRLTTEELTQTDFSERLEPCSPQTPEKFYSVLKKDIRES